MAWAKFRQICKTHSFVKMKCWKYLRWRKCNLEGALRPGQKIGQLLGDKNTLLLGFLELGELGLEDWNVGGCWKH